MKKRVLCAALALSLTLGLCAFTPSLAANDMSLVSLVETTYDDMGYFSDGLVYARMGDEHFYLSAAGKPIIGPFTISDYFPDAPEGAYFSAYEFSQGLAALVVSYYEGADEVIKVLYIDKTGAVKITLDDEPVVAVTKFNEGFAAAALLDGAKLLIGLDGSREKISERIVSTVSDGLFIAVDDNDLLGYMDRDGAFKIPASFDQAFSFNDGLAVVVSGQSWGVINKSGAYVLRDFEALAFSSSSGKILLNGVAMAKSNGKWGLAGQDGSSVGGYKWDGIGRWSDSRFLVTEGELYGIIDNKGAAILAPTYLNIAPITDEYAAAETETGSYIVIDSSGARVSSQTFPIDYVYPTFDGFTDALVPSAVYMTSQQYGLCGLASGLPSEWARTNIERALSLGLVPAALRANYNAPATRSEFCALAVARYEVVTGAEIKGRKEFTDTADINVQKMGALDVVLGVGGGKFSPDSTITREQAAIMVSNLMRALDNPLDKHNATFDDVESVSDWALVQVGQIQGSGIMVGIGGNTFAPKRAYTREESITTMLKLYDLVTE